MPRSLLSCPMRIMVRGAGLNDRQIKVLRLINDGNDLSGTDHSTDRITGRALASRGLVTVSKRHGRWSATITEAGRAYLEHDGLPDGPPRQAARSQDGAPGLAADIVRRLLAAPDRIIRVQQPDTATRQIYRRALRAAHDRNLIPEGFLLQHTGRDQGDIIIRLADRADPDETTWNRIRLNARRVITDPQEISAALEHSTGWRNVTDAAVSDAIVLACCLIAEAHSAGHAIELNTRSRTRLILTMAGIAREVHISETYENVVHQATPEEIRANRRNPRINKIPDFDTAPSGRLTIAITVRDIRTQWTDLTPATFVARVRRLLGELEAATEQEVKHREQERREAEVRRQAWQQQQDKAERARQQQQEDQQRRWQTALGRAGERAVAAIRRATFDAAFEAWTRAAQMRTFCDQLVQLPGGDTDLREWIAWGRDEADRLDPTVGPVALASVRFDVTPGPDDLRIFLGEWSPHGPQPERRSETWMPSPDQSHTNPWHQGLGHRS